MRRDTHEQDVEGKEHVLYAIVPLVTAFVSWLNALMPKLVGGNGVSARQTPKSARKQTTNKVNTKWKQPPTHSQTLGVMSPSRTTFGLFKSR